MQAEQEQRRDFVKRKKKEQTSEVRDNREGEAETERAKKGDKRERSKEENEREGEREEQKEVQERQNSGGTGVRGSGTRRVKKMSKSKYIRKACENERTYDEK